MTDPRERLYDPVTPIRETLRPEPHHEYDAIDLRPATAFEAITRQMVESMAEELREIKGRLNSLIFMMIGAIILEIVTRVIPA